MQSLMLSIRACAALCTLLALSGCAPKLTVEQKRQRLIGEVDQAAARGPFQPSWGSLESFKVPEWYLDAKFGIFIHWGLYSVPAYANEWYPRNMYLESDPVFQYHVKTFGPQTKFGYKDFIPRFRAEKFDAVRWAELFQKSGARFVVPVAEHHDGFPMYDCGLSDWNAARMGPNRDVLGELAKAVRGRNMIFGASSHRAEHWWYFEGGMQFPSDVRDSASAGLYLPARPRKTGFGDESQPDQAFLDDWLARTAEIVDKYEPQLLWFDWWIEQPVFTPYLQRLAAFYYNRGAQWKRGVAINYKNKAFPESAAVLDVERGQLDSIRPLFWQTDTSVSKLSWGYIGNDQLKSPDSIVDDLVDIVSKNGSLLLNIGPRADGTIPEPVEKILLDIGNWLAVNGEAVYGTRPWKLYGECPTKVVAGSFKDTERAPFTGQDIRFTTKGGALYAIVLAWPEGGRLVIQSLADHPVSGVQLLGSKETLRWTRTPGGLTIELPAQKPCEFAFAFKIL